jgi:hypothetical protein
MKMDEKQIFSLWTMPKSNWSEFKSFAQGTKIDENMAEKIKAELNSDSFNKRLDAFNGNISDQAFSCLMK